VIFIIKGFLSFFEVSKNYCKLNKTGKSSSLAANISVKLVPTTFINTYLVSQIPICKMESHILALKKAIGISIPMKRSTKKKKKNKKKKKKKKKNNNNKVDIAGLALRARGKKN
jgi:hypothetical protein